MKTLAIRVGVIILAPLLAGCLQGDVEPATLLTLDGFFAHVPEPTSAYTATDCWPAVSHLPNARCGLVTVPEDHGSPDGPTIQLAVVRSLSAAPDARADPMVYLSGGPGGSGLGAVGLLWSGFEQFVDRRDIISFDQRGTGHSLPALGCSFHDDEISVADAFTACRDDLVAQGVALAHYNTRQNALDVRAVREALGYAEWNLMGISYGTALALTVMRDAPEGIRSVVLDSALPLEIHFPVYLAANAQRAFTALFDACDAQPGCGADYPDLMVTLLQLLDRLDADPYPMMTELGDWVSFDGAALLDMLFRLTYSLKALPYIPLMITRADEGDFDGFFQLVNQVWLGGGTGISIGMYYSVVCSEEVPFMAEEEIEAANEGVYERFRSHFNPDGYQGLCGIWQVPSAPAENTEPVESDIPTLVLSGAFDPVTPPLYGEMVDATLTESRHLHFLNGAHGASLDPCGVQVVRAFFEDPEGAATPSCHGGLEVGVFLDAFGLAAPERLAFARPGEEVVWPDDVIARLRAFGGWDVPGPLWLW